MPVRWIGYGFRRPLRGRRPTSDHAREIALFHAFNTAFSATIGTATSVARPPRSPPRAPGAVFWTWITALAGMAAKYSETLLAVLVFRTIGGGAGLTWPAFGDGIAGGGWIVTFGLIVFAFTTIAAGSYYGESCAEYLFGVKAIMPNRYCG